MTPLQPTYPVDADFVTTNWEMRGMKTSRKKNAELVQYLDNVNHRGHAVQDICDDLAECELLLAEAVRLLQYAAKELDSFCLVKDCRCRELRIFLAQLDARAILHKESSQ